MELCPAIRRSFFQKLALSQPLVTSLTTPPLPLSSTPFSCHFRTQNIFLSQLPIPKLLCLSSGSTMKHIALFVTLVIKALTSRTAMSTSTVATIFDWSLAVLLVLDSFLLVIPLTQWANKYHYSPAQNCFQRTNFFELLLALSSADHATVFLQMWLLEIALSIFLMKEV